MRIASREDNIQASRLLGEIDNLIDSITERREAIIEDVRQTYADYLQPLEKLKHEVKDRMLEYKQSAKRTIEEIKQGIASGKIERSEIYLDDNGRIINEAALTIRTEEGLSSVRNHIIVTIDDITAVPDEFKQVVTKKLREAYRSGRKNIKGVTFTEKPVIQYRGKNVA